ncbi:hypothetical protein LTR66_016460, partial [Elasticomyces elasticus]
MSFTKLPRGYLEQRISSVGESGASYLKEFAVKQWLDENKILVGDQAAFKNLGKGIFDVVVQQKLNI